MADINLIPQSEKQEQAKEKAVKTSTVISVLLFLIVAAISGLILYTMSVQKKAIQAHENSIAALRSDVAAMSEIEIAARNLGRKSNTLQNILEMRSNYSLMLTDFKKRIPETISVESFGIGRDNTINVSGIGNDYISISKFINDLTDGGGLFTNVSLNSVNLDAQSNKAAFFIVITFDPSLLRK